MKHIRALSKSPAFATTSFACVLLAGCHTILAAQFHGGEDEVR